MANRKKEHIMTPLQATGDAELTWEQTDRRGKRFELRAGAVVVAMLDLPRAWNATATARVADGAWEFQRVGFLRPHLLIRAVGATHAGATFAGVGHGKSRVTLRDGQIVTWQPARGKSKQWGFIDAAGQPAVSFIDIGKRSGGYRFTMQIAPIWRDAIEGTLLASLGMYLIVEAVTAAMIAAIAGTTTGA
jgi:hypothetical protein